MKVRFSQYALSELYAALALTAVHDSSAAARLYGKVSSVVDQLEQSVDIGCEVKQRPGIRRLPIFDGRHVVFYTVTKDDVIILRLLLIGRPRVGVSL